MKTDALARRLRFAPPNPQVKRLVLTEPDFLIFEAIDRHGPLPSHYLYEFTKHLRKDKSHLLNRLTEFYNGDDDGPFLTRPQQQFSGYKARYQHLVYDLAPRARWALADRETKIIGGPRLARRDPFLHQLMQACVAASFELTAPAYNLRYIPRAQVLGDRPLALKLDINTTLIPDDLFCLEGEDERGPWRRWCAVEIDRNTESIERKNLGYNTFGKKVSNYLRVLEGRLFEEAWGIKNLTVLTVTTNPVHAVNLIEHVRKQNQPQWAGRFAFSVAMQFGVMWEVPSTVLYQLLGKPWATSQGEKVLTRP